MTIPSRSTQILDRAVDTMAVIGFTGLVIIAFMTVVDVCLRYLGISRIPGLNDLEEVAFAIVIASCFPAGLKKGNAVTVRVLGKLLGHKAHSYLDVIGALFMLLFFGLVAWQFVSFTIDYASAGRTTSTLEWPVAPVWAIVSLIMIACVGVQVWVLRGTLDAAKAGAPVEHQADSL
ncbi:MAG: TRAP transporter small permease [Rhodospirillaceae bacterium]|jgi:TRAP-type C4-dicarboxylate transport system permease small subunit|nr:TRAP transporter small permease [Rhodospirillaceae bacterium]MBT5241495.1 TRAP transporter small permease [Rhodospirillaceae bacterium]MBT5566235.1 TRAP transporter small permease [Rhodospirillaceae bacterium]MBT6088953.1 TRAP transporter small permease [Rhodospirillaceae bacterium]MBT6960570.1 TRAP transporter small permease [Rhodospirillaceae bacterium]